MAISGYYTHRNGDTLTGAVFSKLAIAAVVIVAVSVPTLAGMTIQFPWTPIIGF